MLACIIRVLSVPRKMVDINKQNDPEFNDEKITEMENGDNPESEKDAKTRFQAVKETFHEWSSRTDMNNYGKIF